MLRKTGRAIAATVDWPHVLAAKLGKIVAAQWCRSSVLLLPPLTLLVVTFVVFQVVGQLP